LNAAGSQKEQKATKKKGQIKFFHLELFLSPPLRAPDEEKIKFISKVFVSIYRRGENGRRKI
jgi:hypothetical protein